MSYKIAFIVIASLLVILYLRWPQDTPVLKYKDVPLETCIAYDVSSRSIFKNQQDKAFKTQGRIALKQSAPHHVKGTFKKVSTDLYAPFSLNLDDNATITTIIYDTDVTEFKKENTSALLYEINDLLRTFSLKSQTTRHNRYALGTFITQYIPLKNGLKRTHQGIEKLANKQAYSKIDIIHSEAFLAFDTALHVTRIFGSDRYDIQSDFIPFSTEITYKYEKIPFSECSVDTSVSQHSISSHQTFQNKENTSIDKPSRLEEIFKSFDTNARQQSKRDLIDWIIANPDDLNRINPLFSSLNDRIKMTLFNAMEIADTQASASWLFDFTSDTSQEKTNRLRAVFGINGLKEGASDTYLDKLYHYYENCDDSEVATSLLYAIGSIGRYEPYASRSIALLQGRLESAIDTSQSVAGIQALSNTHNPEVIESLYHYKDSDNAAIKKALYQALTTVAPTPEAKSLLRDALHVESDDVQNEALRALGKMKLDRNEVLSIIEQISSKEVANKPESYLNFLLQYGGLDPIIAYKYRQEQLKSVQKQFQ